MKKSPNAKKLELQKMEDALWKLDQWNPYQYSDSEIHIEFKGETVKYFPLKEWFTGKTVKDGRGIQNLIKQLKQ